MLGLCKAQHERSPVPSGLRFRRQSGPRGQTFDQLNCGNQREEIKPWRFERGDFQFTHQCVHICSSEETSMTCPTTQYIAFLQIVRDGVGSRRSRAKGQAPRSPVRSARAGGSRPTLGTPVPRGHPSGRESDGGATAPVRRVKRGPLVSKAAREGGRGRRPAGRGATPKRGARRCLRSRGPRFARRTPEGRLAAPLEAGPTSPVAKANGDEGGGRSARQTRETGRSARSAQPPWRSLVGARSPRHAGA
jgi:hypothetical protein